MPEKVGRWKDGLPSPMRPALSDAGSMTSALSWLRASDESGCESFIGTTASSGVAVAAAARAFLGALGAGAGFGAACFALARVATMVAGDANVRGAVVG